MNEEINTEETIREQYAKLPPEIQEFIVRGNIRGIIEEFTSLRGLSIETTRAIENEVMFVLLGLELRQDLLKNVQNNVEIEERDAQSIVDKVHKNFFASLGEAFKQLEQTQKAVEALSAETEKKEEKFEEAPVKKGPSDGIVENDVQQPHEMSEAVRALSEQPHVSQQPQQPDQPQYPSQQPDHWDDENEDQEELDRRDILSQIENPLPTQSRHEKMSSPSHEGDTDSGLVSAPAESRGYQEGVDPYREQI